MYVVEQVKFIKGSENMDNLSDIQKKIIEHAMNLPIMAEITKALKENNNIDINEEDLDNEMSDIMDIVCSN